eukprot:1601703-Prorocentrum_lima.AAC.1
MLRPLLPESLLAQVQKLYHGGSARCVYGTLSTEVFSIWGGIRQGCPLSVLLWNSVMSSVLSPLLVEWRKQGCGWRFGLEELWKE